MSIFLRANQTGQTARFFRIRLPFAEIGEDQNGLLSTQPAHNILFSLERRGRDVLLSPRQEVITSAKKRQDPFWLSEQGAFEVGGYCFTFLICTPEFEVGALTGISANHLAADNNRTLPYVSYRLATTHIQVPLFRETPLSAGSSETDALFLPLPGVKSCHCMFTARTNSVVVKPLNGDLAYQGKLVLNPIEIFRPDTVILQPLGVPISVMP
jgi:hypothetical protein